MAANVQSIQQVRFPERPTTQKPEQAYWQAFKPAVRVKSTHPVTHISHPPTGNFAVTSGARIQIFSSRTRRVLKTISRFDDTAHSAEIRHDGKVVIAGDQTGAVQVFDVSSRAILKTWHHEQAVCSTKWHPNDLRKALSASDDGTLQLLDLAGEATTFRGHTDYVRSCAFKDNLLVSGSYDQTVRVWDPRTEKAVMIFKHVAAVETLLVDKTIFSAAENTIYELDMTAGKPLRVLRNHQKTVTCLATSNSRLISGSLDGTIKVVDGDTLVATSKYPSPILSLAVVDKHIAVGMTDQLLIRTRQVTKKIHVKKKSWQRLIHAGQYGEALDVALAQKTAVTCLTELKHRGALRTALVGRLQPVMAWIHEKITVTELVPLCVEVAIHIIDMGGIDTRLHTKVKNEIAKAEAATQTLGMLQLI